MFELDLLLHDSCMMTSNSSLVFQQHPRQATEDGGSWGACEKGGRDSCRGENNSHKGPLPA